MQLPKQHTQDEKARDQLASVFSAYNEITDRMHSSHLQLQDQVKRLREELNAKNELLQRKNRLAALGQMTAGMAHEIRNPLGGVQLYASLLEKDLEKNPQQLKWVQKIITGVRSLDTIVNDMLTFTVDQSPEKIQANLAGLLSEVVDFLRPQIKSQNLKIDVSGVDPKIMVDVDFNMIYRVMMNLILNAVEMVGQNGCVNVTAKNCTQQEQYKVRICVTDDGPGIKKQAINKIFDPFFTTKDSGTGLGLAIVHRLIECHAGVITATNNLPNGATFTILLP